MATRNKHNPSSALEKAINETDSLVDILCLDHLESIHSSLRQQLPEAKTILLIIQTKDNIMNIYNGFPAEALRMMDCVKEMIYEELKDD